MHGTGAAPANGPKEGKRFWLFVAMGIVVLATGYTAVVLHKGIPSAQAVKCPAAPADAS